MSKICPKCKQEIKTVKKLIQEIPATTLEWGDISENEMTWEEANAWCAKQGGRLSTLIELLQAYEDKKIKGSFQSSNYWSATEYNTNYAWAVYFNFGNVFNYTKTTTNYARCVK